MMTYDDCFNVMTGVMENVSFSWDSWDTMGICISYSAIFGVQLKLQMARTMVRHAMTCPEVGI